MFKYLILAFLIGAGCLACSSYKVEKIVYHQLDIDSTRLESTYISGIIQPYKDALKEEMNEVIGQASGDFFKAHPSGVLGNLVADISKEYALEKLSLDTNVACLAILNNGGLRSPISKGNITVGDIFKLMPFDNKLVVLKFEYQVLKEIFEYLQNRGGEPISGLVYNALFFQFNNFLPNQIPASFYVVTTDYLANGGDRMDFMHKHQERQNTEILLRDIIIQFIKEKEVLHPNEYEENRLNFEDE